MGTSWADMKLPDPLVCEDGTTVTTVSKWERVRRPETLQLFKDHVYGRQTVGRPKNMSFHVVEQDNNAMGGDATLKIVEIRIQNDAKTQSMTIKVIMFIPNRVVKPAPGFLMINHRSASNTDPTRERISSYWPAENAIARGYMISAIHTDDIDPDWNSFGNGVHRVFDGGVRLDRGSWGALAAWAWGASRAMDYFETDSDINHSQIAVVGHSRTGKAALVTGAYDQRFFFPVANGSGEGGAALARHRSGESLASIVGGFPYWFCSRYADYGPNVDAMPTDQHQLIALMAPRPVYVASGSDDSWADPKGEFLSLVNARSVYQLYGFDGMGEGATYPSPGTQLIGDQMGYHVHDGGHRLGTWDWARFMDFFDHLRAKVLRKPENPSGTAAGINYTYHEGSWSRLPDFSKEAVVRRGSMGDISLSIPDRQEDRFGVRFEGYLNVPQDGMYQLYTNSDDGSKLYIGSTLVVTNDGAHAARERSGVIGLKAGKHAVTVDYFEITGGQSLSVSWSGPGIGKEKIPSSRFYCIPTSQAPAVSFATPQGSAKVSADLYVRANASDADGYISNLRLYLDGEFVRQENIYPYEWGAGGQPDSILRDLTPGLHTLEVVAKDNDGLTASASMTVEVEIGPGYYVVMAKNSGKALDVYKAQTEDGADFIQWTRHDGRNQQWALEKLSDGNYRMVARHSGKVVDVHNGEASNGTAVHQWAWHGGSNQRWKFEAQSDGYFRIKSVSSNLVLDVSERSTENGALVHMWTWTGNSNQRWKLVRVAELPQAAAAKVVLANVSVEYEPYSELVTIVGIGDASIIQVRDESEDVILTQTGGDIDVSGWPSGDYDVYVGGALVGEFTID